MPNDENKIILEFPATNVEIELGETITFDNISGFLDSGRVTYDGDSLTEKITHLENDKADTTYVDEQLNNKMDKANPTGNGSFSLNRKPSDIGNRSVAIGDANTASGTASFAMGTSTIANHRSQHVFGEFNTPDDSTVSTAGRGNYIEIIGNGTGIRARSNARTLDWQGNEMLAGNLTFNGNKSLTSEISRLDERITDLPEAMVFKGTLGVGGTIQSLPTASAENEGWMFKCITEGTYAGLELKVGDTVTCFNPPNTSVYEWEKTGSQDTDTDTWRNIKVNGVEKLGNGISSGAVDFEDTANVKFEFDADGNKVRAKLEGIYTESDVDDLLDDKADADNTYTKEQVDDIVYGILPDDTASGSVANFETSLELPIKSLGIDVNAVQESGTPTPAAPLPISGRSEISLTKCGKNLLNLNDIELLETDRYGVTISKTGTFYISGSYNGEAFIYARTKSGNTYGEIKYIQIGGQDTATPRSITVGDGETLLLFNASANQTVELTQEKFANIQVEVGSTETTYEPFNGNTEVITLGGTYYGGHLSQDKDGHRQFAVTHKYAILNDENLWQTTTGTVTFFYNYAFTDRKLFASSIEGVICSAYPVGSSNGSARWQSATGYRFGINDNNKTLEQIKELARNNQISICFELATPIIIDLPDGEPIITLNGTNNIFADTGDTSVVFKDSVNGYVEKKIASVQALALNT